MSNSIVSEGGSGSQPSTSPPVRSSSIISSPISSPVNSPTFTPVSFAVDDFTDYTTLTILEHAKKTKPSVIRKGVGGDTHVNITTMHASLAGALDTIESSFTPRNGNHIRVTCIRMSVIMFLQDIDPPKIRDSYEQFNRLGVDLHRSYLIDRYRPLLKDSYLSVYAGKDHRQVFLPPDLDEHLGAMISLLNVSMMDAVMLCMCRTIGRQPDGLVNDEHRQHCRHVIDDYFAKMSDLRILSESAVSMLEKAIKEQVRQVKTPLHKEWELEEQREHVDVDEHP